MPTCRVVDAFPTFLAFWPAIRHKTINEQIAGWEAATKAHYPDLVAMQKACYEEEAEDWRQIAREMVFPHLDERVPGMAQARGHLLALCEPVYALARQRLRLETDLVAVIHVGIGCGAGWATTYQEMPAILFGLENAAEEGWTGPEVLAGLIAHEIGHVAHFNWREQRGVPLGAGPWWQLYCEGFAQRCEQAILEGDSWHMAHGTEGWHDWCRSNEAWLAGEFLRATGRGESVRPFFGSWYQLRGWKQTGYYLGWRVVERLETGMNLREIALLDEIEPLLRNELELLAAAGR